MTLSRLRAHRQQLLAEEVRVSYWRRILQARRDLIRAGATASDPTTIAHLLSIGGSVDARRTMLRLHPEGGMPIFPRLPQLWGQLFDELADDEVAELCAELAEAERALSSYRDALHRRINRASADLVARYNADPQLCLLALPAAS